ncbi:MAG: acyl-CoA thioesterase [Pseudomonadota bacterium]
MHAFPLIVVADDLDNLGHVNNARYLDYLERGRTQWYDDEELVERCAVAERIRRDALGTVVVNVNIDFRAECTTGDALEVMTAPARAGSKSLAVRQEIRKANGELAAEATVTSVVMNLETRKSVVLPPAVKALFPTP